MTPEMYHKAVTNVSKGEVEYSTFNAQSSYFNSIGVLTANQTKSDYPGLKAKHLT